MILDRRTPVLATPEVTSRPSLADGTWRAATSMRITAAEPVFAGHYPKFPIFPGVCVVDCVLGSALATTPAEAGELVLRAVESARFVGAVYPGDLLELELAWTGAADSWSCKAVARTARGKAASVRLTFGREASS